MKQGMLLQMYCLEIITLPESLLLLFQELKDKFQSTIIILIPEGQPRITLPDTKFHRSIGEYADKTYSTSGELLSPEAYTKHAERVLPTPADKVRLGELFKQNDWVLAV